MLDQTRALSCDKRAVKNGKTTRMGRGYLFLEKGQASVHVSKTNQLAQRETCHGDTLNLSQGNREDLVCVRERAHSQALPAVAVTLSLLSRTPLGTMLG